MSQKPSKPRAVLLVFALFLAALVLASCATPLILDESTVTVRSVRRVDLHGSSSIVGIVYDTSGMRFDGAYLELTDKKTGSTVKEPDSCRDNVFQIQQVAPGTYEVSVAYIGFRPAKLDRLSVKANTLIVLDVYMHPTSLGIIDTIPAR